MSALDATRFPMERESTRLYREARRAARLGSPGAADLLAKTAAQTAAGEQGGIRPAGEQEAIREHRLRLGRVVAANDAAAALRKYRNGGTQTGGLQTGGTQTGGTQTGGLQTGGLQTGGTQTGGTQTGGLQTGGTQTGGTKTTPPIAVAPRGASQPPVVSEFSQAGATTPTTPTTPATSAAAPAPTATPAPIGKIGGKPASEVLASMRKPDTENTGNLAALQARDIEARKSAIAQARAASANPKSSETRSDVIDKINAQRKASGMAPFDESIYSEMAATDKSVNEFVNTGIGQIGTKPLANYRSSSQAPVSKLGAQPTTLPTTATTPATGGATASGFTESNPVTFFPLVQHKTPVSTSASGVANPALTKYNSYIAEGGTPEQAKRLFGAELEAEKAAKRKEAASSGSKYIGSSTIPKIPLNQSIWGDTLLGKTINAINR